MPQERNLEKYSVNELHCVPDWTETKNKESFHLNCDIYFTCATHLLLYMEALCILKTLSI